MLFIHKKKNLSRLNSLLSFLLLQQYRLVNLPIYIFAKKWFQPLKQQNIVKILLLRQGGIGDTVVALPAINAIRNHFPGAEIHLLTHHVIGDTVSVPDLLPVNFFRKIFKYKKFVDEDILRQLKHEKYDLFIELPSDKASLYFELRSVWLAKRIGVKYGIGWQVSSTTFLKKQQEKLLYFENEQNRLLKILSKYIPGLVINGQHTAQLSFPAEKEQSINFNQNTKKQLALAFSAGEAKKIWPLNNFTALANYFSNKGFEILLIGGQSDKTAADEICRNVKQAVNLCGNLNIHQTAAALRNCHLLISNDTGAIHLAYSVGTAVIGIYSGKDYSNRWFPPESPYNKVLRNASVPCIICYKQKCANNICMQNITVDEVIKQSEALLQQIEATDSAT